MQQETITLSLREADQIAVFEKLKNQQLRQHQAALQLGLSVRQIKRKLREYRRSGAASLAHRARGRPSNRQLPAELKDQALEIVREQYPDFGPTLAAEKLAEVHGLVIGHETLRGLMAGAGLWRPKRFKQPEAHVWRERKAHRGELVQLDGSPHAWFEGRGPRCTLLGFIDDATGNTYLEFADSESTRGVLTATRHYLVLFGRPVAMYSDRGSVFKVSLGNAEDDKLTQYERALHELDIRPIHARSPQAKGRVERAFQTHQDRLVKELRLAGISSIPEANRFLREVYLPKHNAKFAILPRESTDLHRSVDGRDLDQILCLKNARLVANDLTIRYQTRLLQLTPKQLTIVRPKDTVMVHESLTGGLSLWLRSTRLTFTEVDPARFKPTKPPEQKPKQAQKPAADHPWRHDNIYAKRDISKLQKRDILILR